MWWSLLLAGTAFTCAWLLQPGAASRLRQVFPAAGLPSDGVSSPGSSRFLLLIVAGSAVLTWWVAHGYAAVLLLLVPVGLIGVVVVRRLLGDWRRRKARRRRQIEVIGLCDALAAEMRSGLPTRLALARSCELWPDLAPVLAADRVGGDVADALRVAAAQSGAEGLRAVAAAWEVAATSGVALADVLDRVAVGLRHDDEARAEVTAALGPPRATAKMLAALPALGLGMGVAMGAAPLDFLLRSEAGWLCLAAGITLATLGLLWVERLAQSAEI
ncbi:MAG: type II secretion system F family protein [Nocardioidaceae bacterium]|nr:type II secretion system F family protein [Nocardioidaceae bacterium]